MCEQEAFIEVGEDTEMHILGAPNSLQKPSRLGTISNGLLKVGN